MKFLDVPQSGSIAGTTHSHNRAGQYTRNRRAPVQPVGTGRRAFIRAAFGAASAGWASLTDAQRAAWDSFANSHPVTDSLGQSITLTGHQMYVRVATTLTNVGSGSTGDPPVDLALPDVTALTCTFVHGTGVSVGGFTGESGSFVAVAVSMPMSPGRTFNKTFWQPLGADGYKDGNTSPWTLTTAKYAAEFGTPPVGQAIFVRVTPISADGWNGTPAIVKVPIT